MKRWMRTSVAGSMAAVLFLAGGSLTANAAELDEPPVGNGVSELISSVTGNNEPLLDPLIASSELLAVSTDGDVEVTLPVDGGEISLVDQAGGPSAGISLPLEATVESAVVAEDGTVVYAADIDNDGVDVAVQIIEDGSVRIQTVISTSNAPHEFTYPLTLPEGTSLNLEEDGSVMGLDPEGRFVAGVQAPWAKDVDGNDVPTSFRIEGNSIVQTINPVAADRYPVVADPYFGIQLISKAVWAKNLWQYSPTLKVYPTSFGRNVYWGAPPAARWAAWTETLAKTPRSGWPNPNNESMKNQFYCHFDLVRFRAPNKEYWGLDSKIPNRGYAGFLKTQCN